MEAGNRCLMKEFLKKLNRKIVDHLSDINLPIIRSCKEVYGARRYSAETIIKIGSSMPEVLNNQKKKINSSRYSFKIKFKRKRVYCC